MRTGADAVDSAAGRLVAVHRARVPEDEVAGLSANLEEKERSTIVLVVGGRGATHLLPLASTVVEPLLLLGFEAVERSVMEGSREKKWSARQGGEGRERGKGEFWLKEAIKGENAPAPIHRSPRASLSAASLGKVLTDQAVRAFENEEAAVVGTVLVQVDDTLAARTSTVSVRCEKDGKRQTYRQ